MMNEKADEESDALPPIHKGDHQEANLDWELTPGSMLNHHGLGDRGVEDHADPLIAESTDVEGESLKRQERNGDFHMEYIEDRENRQGDTDSGEEEAVSQKEDDWIGTIAAVSGNVLEWYDFAVFGFFSDILGEVFFPPNQKGHAALVESFVVFGGAFLMRPIGGMLMGYIGDTYGSRKSLTISIFLMAFPTFAMGCLPTYKTVGPFAIVLLSIVRLLQGLSVGGQLMSSLVFSLERHPKSKWGLYGSFVMVAANVGALMGGVIAATIRNSLDDEALRSWGWRLPFLGGILASLPGWYLRSHEGDDVSSQTHLSSATSGDECPPNPIKLAFSRPNRRSLLASCMVPLLWSAGFYLTFVWMAIYMKTLIETPIDNAFFINSASLAFSACLLFPAAGWLSDKLGRKPVMTVGAILLAALSPTLIIAIGSGNAITAFIAQSSLGICLSLWGAPMMAWLMESFEPAARLTSVSIGYNIAQALGGGMAPAIATEMVDSLGAKSPGFYLSAIAIIALIGLLCVAPSTPIQDGERNDTGDEQERAFNYDDRVDETGADDGVLA